MLFIIAKVPDIIKGIMGQKDLGFGSAIGEAMGPLKTAGQVGQQYAIGSGLGYTASKLRGVPSPSKQRKHLGAIPAKWGQRVENLRKSLQNLKLSS